MAQRTAGQYSAQRLPSRGSTHIDRGWRTRPGSGLRSRAAGPRSGQVDRRARNRAAQQPDEAIVLPIAAQRFRRERQAPDRQQETEEQPRHQAIVEPDQQTTAERSKGRWFMAACTAPRIARSAPPGAPRLGVARASFCVKSTQSPLAVSRLPRSRAARAGGRPRDSKLSAPRRSPPGAWTVDSAQTRHDR